MSETTTWKHCCECRRRFAFYAEIDKSRCYECELKRKAYREGYEAFRREMVEALRVRRDELYRLYSLKKNTRDFADAHAADWQGDFADVLADEIEAGTFPPKPREGT